MMRLRERALTPDVKRESAVTFQTKFGTNIFKFSNGDVYLGSYKISPPETVAKSGYGMYICHDKHVFIGEWVKNEMVYGKVKFPERTEYIGNLIRHTFHGKGIYSIPGVGKIVTTFQNHCPTEGMVLVDENGLKWRGSAEDEQAELTPVNQFMENPLFGKELNWVPRTQAEDSYSPEVKEIFFQRASKKQ